MRKILFRGKHFKTGKWVTGLLWHHTDKASAIYSDDKDRLMWVDPETVGQYTGKTDIGGQKIFEGDIVTYNDCYNSPEKGIVRYRAPEFLLETAGRFAHHHRLIDSEDIRDAQVLFTAKYEYKIIGNIHDNKELLGR